MSQRPILIISPLSKNTKFSTFRVFKYNCFCIYASHTSLLFQPTLTLCCLITAYLVDALPANYRPYYHERTTYITDYDDNNGRGSRSHDQGNSRQRQQSHSSHGSSDYGEGESHSLRDRINKNKFDQGSKSSVSKSGGKKDQVKKSHDRGFYEKEKR